MNTVILLAALAAGQDTAPQPKPRPKTGAEARREARDSLVRSVGKEAQGFCRRFGDAGITSLQAVKPGTGKRLVEVQDELAKLKHPRAALDAIRRHGEEVAVYVIDRMDQLADPVALEAFVRKPLEYVYGLKDLDQAAANLRESRRYVPPMPGPAATAGWNVSYLFIAAILLLGYIVWKRSGRPRPDRFVRNPAVTGSVNQFAIRRMPTGGGRASARSFGGVATTGRDVPSPSASHSRTEKTNGPIHRVLADSRCDRQRHRPRRSDQPERRARR